MYVNADPPFFCIGMGPNRPPPYDVFRSRQAKRHRDDPGY